MRPPCRPSDQGYQDPWEGRLLSSKRDPEVQARILNNARAGLWERFRNEAARRWPGLDDAELDAKAAEIRSEQMAKARDALWESFRDEAARRWPDLTGDELEAAAAEVRREQMSAAGRKGRERQAVKVATADAVLARLPLIEELLLLAYHEIRAAGGITDPVAPALSPAELETPR